MWPSLCSFIKHPDWPPYQTPSHFSIPQALRAMSAPKLNDASKNRIRSIIQPFTPSVRQIMAARRTCPQGGKHIVNMSYGFTKFDSIGMLTEHVCWLLFWVHERILTHSSAWPQFHVSTTRSTLQKNIKCHSKPASRCLRS